MNGGADIPDSLVKDVRKGRADNKGKEKKYDIPIGDPDRGRQIFASCCSYCHMKESNAWGPRLSQVYLAPNANEKSYPRYSVAMRMANLYWTREKLFEFITDPKGIHTIISHGT